MFHELVERIARVEALERLAEPVAWSVRPLVAARPVRNALSGVWLGHRLHPLLTDVVIGSLASAALLDLVGGRPAEDGADLLVAAGIAAAAPTAAAGLSDWVDVTDRGRRLGLVHAAANVAGLALHSASLACRRSGHRRLGKALSLAGLGIVGVGGYLGGHLSYVMGVGVDHTAFHEGPKDWTVVLDDERELVEDRPRMVTAGEREILLVRRPEGVVALDNRCTHAGWPLAGGEVRDGCITCPNHGSVFRLDDGSVVAAPAASPQPRYETRVRDRAVEVRGR
jgi:nitrite reductase/ring-hydroxylating ferredoxin subunit/uncharacterized membrane protein